MMIRCSSINLKSANAGKRESLDRLTDECLRVLNVFIDDLWTSEPRKFPNQTTDTWLSARLQQSLSKQAAETVKSQRKKKAPTKPVVRQRSFNLDERFIDLRFDANSFDLWVRLSSLGDRLILKLPSRKHRHLNRLLADNWTLRKGGRLRRTDQGYFLDLCLEKPESPKRTTGNAVGFDCGYKKLLVDSDGTTHDVGLEPIYEKIARRKQRSKGFYRALAERDNAINRTINQLDLDGVQTVVVEVLKHVKRGSRGKISKKFNNKLQRWSYPKVLGKLSRACEEAGVTFIEVNPAYTSQTCSSCGHTDKRSRNGSSFICTSCGTSMDADYNAAINILHRGTFRPSAAERMQARCCIS